MEEIDCRWIWALDIHKVKVESDKVGFCKLELFSDQMLMPVGRLFFRSTETGTNPQHWIHAIRESAPDRVEVSLMSVLPDD